MAFFAAVPKRACTGREKRASATGSDCILNLHNIMKHLLIKLSALAIAGLILTNCGSVQKTSSNYKTSQNDMTSQNDKASQSYASQVYKTSKSYLTRNYEGVKVACAPEVLELNNGIIAADLTVDFPGKYFNPKTVVKITPVLVYEGGETAGAPKFFQGLKVNDNYTVVSEESSRHNHHVEFAYKPEMNPCELQIRVEVKCPSCDDFRLIHATTGAYLGKEDLATLAEGGQEARKLKKNISLTVARGLSVLQNELLSSYANYMSTMAHGYERQTSSTDRTDILYKINDSSVDRNADKAQNLLDFRTNVDLMSENDRASQKITVSGYASPDGPEGRNVTLSEARSKTAREVVAKLLKDSGLDVDASAYGEDWDGLYEAVAASDVKDKDMILQVLRMYKDKPSAVRESELRNLTEAFEELKSDVLPGLRRAKVVNTTTVLGYTDAELLDMARAGRYDELNLEELRYVGEIAPDNATKEGALAYAAKKYEDAAAYNNLGVLYAKTGRLEKAAVALKKSAELGGSATELNNNLALLNIGIGNVEGAKPFLNSANDQVKGLAAAAEGNYAAASRSLKGIDAAIAQVMEGNYAAAKRTIAGDSSAAADYLRAVIASKEGDKTTAAAQIRSAIQKDPKLAAKAKADANLVGIQW